MTRYEELIKHLFSLSFPGQPKEIIKLISQLGDPHLAYPTIHVAGTNGKGSVTHMIAKTLELSGYKVGHFTSPHLFSFTERIQVNGKPILETEVVESLEKLFALSENPKFFELTTALAFDYFAKKKVDIAVIETGLGGRLDATNIVKPLVSIINSIDFDHQAILGSTLDAIAFEKGGIIKQETPVVLGPNVHQKILFEIAKEKKAPLFHVEGVYAGYEEENEAVVLKALELLSSRFPQNPKAIREGLLSRPPCRFEIIRTPEPVIFDVAHNFAALLHVFAKLKKLFPRRPIYLLFSCSKDKEFDRFVDLFCDQVEEIFLFSSLHERLIHPQRIAIALNQKGYKNYIIEENAERAFEKALQQIEKTKGVGLVTGSFFMMNEFFEAPGHLRGYNRTN